MGVFHCLFELLVQQELEVAVEASLGRFFLGKGGHFASAVFGPGAPLAENGRAVDVPEDAENCIREQPVLVGLQEGFVGRGR